VEPPDLTAPTERHDSNDHRDNPDKTQPMLIADATENTQAKEPTDPIDKIEPDDPIDRIEPDDPIDKIDPLDPMLSSESRLAGRAASRSSERMPAFSQPLGSAATRAALAWGAREVRGEEAADGPRVGASADRLPA
jgi:hypothetical protein